MMLRPLTSLVLRACFRYSPFDIPPGEHRAWFSGVKRHIPE